MIPGLCSLVYRGGAVGSFSAIAAPSAVYGSNGQTSGVGPSAVMTIGGTSPFTYSWVLQAGDASITANSPTAASTTFDCGSLSPGDNINATFICTVTDAHSNVVNTNTVNAFFSLST